VAYISVIDQIKDFYNHSHNLMASDVETPAHPHMLSLFSYTEVMVIDQLPLIHLESI
jgi:hypothetical protein